MPYLFTDEWAWQSNNGPEENATAQDDLSVEAVAQVTKDGSCHHEATDEDCGRKKVRKRYFGESIWTENHYWCGHVVVCFEIVF